MICDKECYSEEMLSMVACYKYLMLNGKGKKEKRSTVFKVEKEFEIPSLMKLGLYLDQWP